MSPLIALVLFQGKTPTASIAFTATKARAGQPVRGILTLTLPAGLHGYQNPPADKFENPISLKLVDKGFQMIKVDYPKGETLRLPGLPQPTKVYQGTIKIPFLFLASRSASSNAATNVSVAVRYQLCSLTNCWPPKQLIVKAPLQVVK